MIHRLYRSVVSNFFDLSVTIKNNIWLAMKNKKLIFNYSMINKENRNIHFHEFKFKNVSQMHK